MFIISILFVSNILLAFAIPFAWHHRSVFTHIDEIRDVYNIFVISVLFVSAILQIFCERGIINLNCSSKDDAKRINEQIKVMSNIYVAIAAFCCVFAFNTYDRDKIISITVLLNGALFAFSAIYIFERRKSEEEQETQT